VSPNRVLTAVGPVMLALIWLISLTLPKEERVAVHMYWREP
jgi:hypothetical protein